MIFSGFVELHLKGISSFFPFLKFSVAVCELTAASFRAGAIYIPITNTKISCWEAVLPAVLVTFGVENLLLVLLRGDVALPLLLAVTVLPAHPAVEVHGDFRVIRRHVNLLPVVFVGLTGYVVAFSFFWLFSQSS